MRLLGLTGGIGTGKSTAASFLSRRGIAVIDTDVLARELVGPAQPALSDIAAAFGPQILDEQGRLRRGALAEIVFSSPEKLQQLEAILHPRIRERWTTEVERWRREGKAMGVIVIPLLFETNAQQHFDAVVCTACSRATQQDRLRARGWTDVQIEQRLAAQWPLERKVAAASHVLWTEGDLNIHDRQIERILGEHR